MPVPTPQERPDLYDYYDSLPEGHVSSIKLEDPPHLVEREKEYAAERAARQQPAPGNKNGQTR